MTKQTAARMGRLVAQWRRSGASQAGFARRHGIPTWTFWYWCRKLSKPGVAEPAAAAATFVPVHVAAEPAGLEIILTSGERLQIHGAVSAELLRAVVTAFRPPC